MHGRINISARISVCNFAENNKYFDVNIAYNAKIMEEDNFFLISAIHH
jgi:hypothetical protein